jgi:uncharacterized Fe-S center protein
MSVNHYDDNTVYFIDARGHECINKSAVLNALNAELCKTIERVFNTGNAKNCLLKVHTGDPLNDTFMLPDILMPIGESLKKKGIEHVVLGDTTVAYSGKRGYKENPEGNVSEYLKLAKEHGFDFFPFVVLDRPISSVEGFGFDVVHDQIEVDDKRIRYKKIYASGGFLSSDAVINNAH